MMNTALLAISKKSSMVPTNRMAEAISFSQVYQTYRHKMYSYVYYRVGGDAPTAEDIVSDIFVKAYQKFDTYNDQYALSTWLYTIARNTLIDHYRKGKETVDIDALELADQTDPLYVLIDSNISYSEVADAIADLPEQQRLCITEQFLVGKTAKEIAAEQDMSHAAVRKTVSRGVAALRSALLQVVIISQAVIF